MSRVTKKDVKTTERCHSRIKDHKREGETMSGCIERAFDALDREQEGGPKIDIDALVDLIRAANEPGQTLQVSELVDEMESIREVYAESDGGD